MTATWRLPSEPYFDPLVYHLETLDFLRRKVAADHLILGTGTLPIGEVTFILPSGNAEVI